MLQWLTPEVIQQLGVAVAAIIGAATAWQAKIVSRLRSEVQELRGEVSTLKTEAEKERGRFRDAIRLIRGLLRHIDDLVLALREHAPHHQPPPVPPTPTSLEEEI